MVVIKVQPHEDPELELPVGFSYLVNLDTQAQTMQLANDATDALLFASKQEAADFWNTRMGQLSNPPAVHVMVEAPTLH